MEFDAVVIGGGAAGLMCAATAGYRGRRILVIEHGNKVGKKILMSGGGRCNFTNYVVEPHQFLSANPHFCKSALSRYTPADFIELVDRHSLAWHEKAKGQLFCDNKAKDLLAILLKECEYAGVSIRTCCSISKIKRTDNGYCLQSTLGVITCESLIVATGGLSIPTLGATGKGYEIARQFGLNCTDTQASLVPFTLQGKWRALAQELAGVALEAEISCNRQGFQDGLLFTHRGLSGPAVLQISNYWQPGDQVTIDFLPGTNLLALLSQWRQQGKKSSLKNLLSEYLPKRFAQVWLDLVTPRQTAHQYNDQELAHIAGHFQDWVMLPPGTEGYRTAEVTRGGVSTDEVSSKTFEAKKVPGLYFIGEVLDVTGWLGGFNFQWAWASGYCAGQYV